IRLNVPGWERELGYAAEAARTLGIGLELETVGCEDNGQLKALIRSFAENQIPLEALFAFSSSEYVSNRDIISTLITLRDEAKLTFRIGGGTRGYFAEFNRAELPID
ncbi:hypothetical protein K0U00_50570, partial [Paenibacillus sepulcri]|nr:hypothetical protein [Paenibacillus sepulcri]